MPHSEPEPPPVTKESMDLTYKGVRFLMPTSPDEMVAHKKECPSFAIVLGRLRLELISSIIGRRCLRIFPPIRFWSCITLP